MFLVYISFFKRANLGLADYIISNHLVNKPIPKYWSIASSKETVKENRKTREDSLQVGKSQQGERQHC